MKTNEYEYTVNDYRKRHPYVETPQFSKLTETVEQIKQAAYKDGYNAGYEKGFDAGVEYAGREGE